MKKVAFAGTFDPITKGHLWVIEEGLNIADEVIVMIAHNPNKKTLFSDMERKEMIDRVLEEREIAHKVKTVLIRNEYVAQSAEQYGCSYLIRGIRSALDFDYESLIQKTNTDVLMGAKTLFVMPPRELESVSSSFVKSLTGPVGWHWNIKEFLSTPIYEAWIKKYILSVLNEYLSHKIWTTENKDKLLSAVFISYQETGRYYHTLEHIVHALQELQWVISNYKVPEEYQEQLILALLVHDIIYNSSNKSSSDEEQSAKWFENFSNEISYPKKQAKVISDMVRTTAYLSDAKKVTSEVEEILCSIDLAILAQHSKTYNWYTNAVRKEYSFVSDYDFSNGRIKALETLLQKEKLYLSKYFEHYEERARNNMKREIILLKSLQSHE